LEFHALGVDTLFPISAEHGIGVSDLMEKVVDALPVKEEDEDPDSGSIRVAVVGRPNVGKSTLVNRLLGDNRLLTADQPGTTRDAIDTELTVGDKRYVLIDTAGVRRKRSIGMALEKFSVIKAFQSIERADVVVVMTDSTEGFTDQDARIANMAIEHGRALIIACNKWDLVEKDSKTADDYVKDFHGDRVSLAFAPVVFISALSGQRSHRVLQLVDTVYENWNRRIPTGQLNRWFEETTSRTPPPLHHNRAVRFYYITQARSAPPTFIVQSNMPEGVQTAYKRFLQNQFRSNFMFEGSPLRLFLRKRGKKNS
jgi:GTP-binding protein